MIFTKTTFTSIPLFKLKHPIQDFIITHKYFIYASTIYLHINHHKINLYDEIHNLILKNIFLYIIMKNTRILVYNIEDLELVSIYEGLCDLVIDVKYTDTYIYVLSKSNYLYKTFFTDLKYKIIQDSIQMFALDMKDNLVLIDLVNSLFYKDEEEIFVKDLRSIEYIDGIVKIFDTHLIISGHRINFSKLKFYKNGFICTQKYIYDIKNKNYFKISNIDFIRKSNNRIFYIKENILYEMKI